MAASLIHMPAGRILRPVVTMLLGSVVLGLVYNATSPLGVRGSRSPAITSLHSASLPSIPSPYLNDTTSIAIDGGSDGSALPGNSVYQNQTVALTFSGLTPAPDAVAPQPAGTRFNRAAIPTLTWAATKPLLARREVVLVDARLTPHFQAGHIPGAVSLPLTSSLSEKQAFLAQYPPTTPLVIYCGSSACSMGHDLAENLVTAFGYRDVRVMPGGFAEYRQAEASGNGAP